LGVGEKGVSLPITYHPIPNTVPVDTFNFAQCLREAQPTPSAGVARAYPLAVKSLLRQLQAILEEMAALEQEIAISYADHPNRELIDAMPGMAQVTGPIITAGIGTDMTRFADLRTLKAYCGTSPVTEQSGKFRCVHIRRACNRDIRRAIHLAAGGAINKCPWARELYDRLKAEGKSHGRALRAVADQLIEMLYVVLTRRPLKNSASFFEI
jgi:transposase